MQHLLDFIREHSADDQLYYVARTPAGDLELLWRRAPDPLQWLVRPHACEGPWEPIQHLGLLAELAARNVDTAVLRRQIEATVAIQIAFSDMVLRDARKMLGQEAVRDVLLAQAEFLDALRTTVTQLAPPAPHRNLVLLAGGGARTRARSGHLNAVSAPTTRAASKSD